MNKPNQKNQHKLLRFSALGFQMMVIIGGFAALGQYLDRKSSHKQPWWTIGCVLFGIFAALYLIIREVIQMNKNEK
jgi:ATP synthase protein I